MTMRIQLSGGDYNGCHLNTETPVKPGDYLLIEKHPNDRIADHYYLVHSNGVARHDPHYHGSALLFAAGEVEEMP